MDDIFEIKFPIESEIKDKVITKFSTKQGGAFAIFSYYWQCFVWAATIGFLRDEKRPLGSPSERIFSLNTMRNNGGDKDAQALICMCIARNGSLDIMKEPEEAVRNISEYANGGFYHILKLMENGENSFNDFEKVKQEIFSRNYSFDENIILEENAIESYGEQDTKNEDVSGDVDNSSKLNILKKTSKWKTREENELFSYYKQGMSIKQLATYFDKDESSVIEKLESQGIKLNK
ncbi:MAG: hypothetical protein MJY95_01755 [Bacteroidaceae bacterium]|nr:hypothetical protein [Bacteroidaceae bacterium]